MRNKIICLLLVMIAFLVSFNYFKVLVIETKSVDTERMLAMNLEQTFGAGDYKLVTQSNWPTEGYKFNAELSRCENDSALSWDSNKSAVVFHGRVTDKCYIYFDKMPQMTLVEYVLSQYTGVQGENNIYYHDSSLTNGAKDNSYRYAGASDSVNNFVCFGTDATPCPENNLYRIVGVIDDKVKLIKYDYASSDLLGTDGDYKGSFSPDATYYKGSLTTIQEYYFNYKTTNTYSNDWNTSLLNKVNLNTNFLNNIGSVWANMIEDAIWKVSGYNSYSVTAKAMYTAEITNATKTYGPTNGTSKIGLMYASDYGFAASPSAWTKTLNNYNGNDANGISILSINWMYMGVPEWLIIPWSSNSFTKFFLNNNGSVSIIENYNSIKMGSRPTFYLKDSIKYVEGLGTKDSPIIITID